MGAREYLTVILHDNTSNKTSDAIEIATEAAERGAKNKNSNSRVETVFFSNLDSDVSWDNYLWSMILRADSLIFIASFNSRLSENVTSFLRKTTGLFIRDTRIASLIVNYIPECVDCGRNFSVKRTANSIFRCWSARNNLNYVMDASINVSNLQFSRDDLNYWRDMSFVVGENLGN